MATQTKTESRRHEQTNGHEHNQPTPEQVRKEQDRFARLQQSYQDQAHHQVDDVQRQLEEANQTGREALSQYVRGITRGYQALMPQATIDPHQAIDFMYNFAVQTAELQRNLVHELVGAGRVNARAANRAVEDFSENR